eukprot:scaffold370378_cov19-Prasinocladus_malaysianus.AAC.2
MHAVCHNYSIFANPSPRLEASPPIATFSACESAECNEQQPPQLGGNVRAGFYIMGLLLGGRPPAAAFRPDHRLGLTLMT